MNSLRDTCKRIQDAIAEGTVSEADLDFILERAEQNKYRVATLYHTLFCSAIQSGTCPWSAEVSILEEGRDPWKEPHHSLFLRMSTAYMKELGITSDKAPEMFSAAVPIVRTVTEAETKYGKVIKDIIFDLLTGRTPEITIEDDTITLTEDPTPDMMQL